MIVIADIMLSDVAKWVGYFVLAVISAGLITLLGKMAWTTVWGILKGHSDDEG